jgi:hypothetical protein
VNLRGADLGTRSVDDLAGWRGRGVRATELIRADQVAIDEAGAAVTSAKPFPLRRLRVHRTSEAKRLAEALVELADYADGKW